MRSCVALCKFFDHFVHFTVALDGCDHVVSILVGPDHVAVNHAELQPNLDLLRPPDPRVGDGLLVVREEVPLIVFKLEDTHCQEDDKEYVENIGCRDVLGGKRCKGSAIVKSGP